MTNGPLTFGEKAVGLGFNPSADPNVDKIKRMFAEIIDFCDVERHRDGVGVEQIRMYSVAITEAQSAQMWAVKAATWKE